MSTVESNECEKSLNGEWSSFSIALTPENQAVFFEAMQGHVGAQFIPFAISKKMDTELTYIYLCNGKNITLDLGLELYSVHISQEFGNSPILKQIIPIAEY